MTKDKEMPERIFVAVGRHSWGKAPTIEKAIAECRKAGASGRRGKDIKVFLLPEYATDGFVDGMGNIRWTGPNNAIVDVT